MPKRTSSSIVSFVLLCLCCIHVGCASMGSLSPLGPLERKMIYHPAPMPDSIKLPADAGIVEANFQSADGTKLHGWYLPCENKKAVALFMHGNAGNIADRIATLKILNQRHRLSVMTFDYRGYGRSEGKPSEKGILQDARAARKWLAANAGIQEQDIVLMGRSLGGGVATDLAAKDGARGLVLASTFTSLPEVGKHHFSLLPTNLLMTQRLDSKSKIADYHGPLLQSHGDADRVIPFTMGQELFDSANEPKQFVTIPGGGHNDPQTEEYRVALDEFLNNLR